MSVTTRDVFTQIAKDVVGQGLDHGTLTFKVIRSPRGLLHNQCGVSGGTTAFSDVIEGKEKKKPASRMVLHKACYVNFREFLRKTWSDCTKDFSQRIGRPEVDLATIGRKASLCARCYIYSRVFFVTNVFDALVNEDFS
ncbi:hypothetical protein DY000_02032681 [Brassica cretica]|uniref:Uncharacterized protein n=1 Tax=Brassica cretica TaxID=69181 RepID=A0ABQ7DQT7_BRACR|nr:hypothetical protein DY000_02032681 [Brassica cretica]